MNALAFKATYHHHHHSLLRHIGSTGKSIKSTQEDVKLVADGLVA